MTTVEELMVLCEQEIQKGNGKREVLISDDDEGNGFHYLFYGFSSTRTTEEFGYDPNKQILLG